MNGILSLDILFHFIGLNLLDDNYFPGTKIKIALNPKAG
jgi:hypothetical protein